MEEYERQLDANEQKLQLLRQQDEAINDQITQSQELPLMLTEKPAE